MFNCVCFDLINFQLFLFFFFEFYYDLCNLYSSMHVFGVSPRYMTNFPLGTIKFKLTAEQPCFPEAIFVHGSRSFIVMLVLKTGHDDLIM